MPKSEHLITDQSEDTMSSRTRPDPDATPSTVKTSSGTDLLADSERGATMRGDAEDSVYLLPGQEDFEDQQPARTMRGGMPSKGRSRTTFLPSTNTAHHTLPRMHAVRVKKSQSFIASLPDYTLLISLYFLQGIPLGLVHGTIPYLLKSKASNDLTFTDLGLFSLAAYPYSLKLLWSPLVDSVFWPTVGRRKSWIIPAQLAIGILFIVIGYHVDAWIAHADDDIQALTMAFTALILFCATQDIAVDGWALTLLEGDQVQYSSTCQTVGLNSGYFTAFTIFLALSSPEFCNHYLRREARPEGILEIAPFLKFWGVISLLATLFVILFKREAKRLSEHVPRSLTGAYTTILRILRLPNVRSLALILIFSRIGFTALDAIVPLKLIEKGYPREKIALTVLIDFPCQLAVGFFAPYLAQQGRPLWGWHRGIILKLVIATISMLVLWNYPAGQANVSTLYFLLILLMTMLSSLASTLMFVTMGAFFSVISDPTIGGTYMTLLNTMANLGGMLPKLLVMAAVDWFTVRSCPPGTHGNSCTLVQDGFYIVNTVCIALGAWLMHSLIVPTVNRLESLVPQHWHINYNPGGVLGTTTII